MEELPPAPSKSGLVAAVAAFAEVSERFMSQNSLLYVSSVASLESALRYIDTPEATIFLADHLLKMVHTLLRHHVTKGRVEHQHICTSLSLSLQILFKIPTNILFERHLDSLALLLDEGQTFYSGGNLFTYQALLKSFASRDGFQLILNAPRNAETGQSMLWVSGKPEIFCRLLSALAKYSGLDAAFKSTFVEMALSLVMSLTEDQLRTLTSNSNPLQSILQTLNILSRQTGDTDLFFQFALDHTNKLLHLAPFAIKQFAWEQVQELVTEALNSEPHVSGYVVSGAGLDTVNGTYMHNGPSKDNSSLLYVKCDASTTTTTAAAVAEENQPALMLYRCKMQKSGNWWFLSMADKLSYGTNKDIDFYQHKCNTPSSVPDQHARAPPLEGWELAPPRDNTPNQHHPTLSMMPQLTPLGKLLEAGVTEEMTFPSRLVKWSLDRKLIDQAFGSSFHRAIVGSSKSLLDFLARRDRISLEDLTTIYKSALSEDADTSDEVLTMLAEVAIKLDGCKFGQLVDLIIRDVQNPDKFPRVAMFLEKFNPLPLRPPVPDLTRLLDLLWAVYQSKSFPTLVTPKNPLAVESLQHLLSSCMCEEAGKVFAIERISECVDAIEEENVRKTPGKKSIQLLDFLTSLPVMNSIIDDIQKLKLPDKLIAELGRFVLSNRSEETSLKTSSFEKDFEKAASFSEEIFIRLKVVRQYYGFSNGNIPRAMLDALWTLFQSQPLELDAFFRFLTVPVSITAAAADRDGMASSREHIFVSYICSPQVDWSKIKSSAGFACFYTHYLALYNPTNLELQELGLRTLWTIFRTVPDAEMSPEIVHLLLQAYHCDSASSSSAAEFSTSSSAYKDFLSLIFEMLTAAGSSSTSLVRCVDLLRSAITMSGPMNAASHAVRGVMGRINVIVNYRTSLAQLPESSRAVNYARDVEGTTSIELHPMETARSFKEKLAATLKWQDVRKIYFKSSSLRDCHDSCPLQFLSIDAIEDSDTGCISEGTVVDCTYWQPSTHGADLSSSLNNSFGNAKMLTIGDLLATNEAHFKSLLSMCDAEKKAWDLIMVIPTQVDYERNVRTAMRVLEGGGDCWGPLLGSPDAAVVAYNLQIVDFILQPAPEEEKSEDFSKGFISSGGLSYLLQVLITSTSSASGSISSVSQTKQIEAALHILRLLLAQEGESAMVEISRINVGVLVEKILAIAARDNMQDGVVEDALSTINYLVRDEAVTSQLIQHQQTKNRIITASKSQTKLVRRLTAELTIKLGMRQPIVFSWLVADLSSGATPGTNSQNLFAESFVALNTLLQHFCVEADDNVDFQSLATLLSEKMLSPKDSRDSDEVMLGYLSMLNTLITSRPEYVLSTRLGKNFVPHFFEDYLFCLDETSKPASPLLRQAVFNVLGTFLSISPASAFEEVMTEISKLSDSVSGLLKGWLCSQGEVKKPDITLSGLKNQGCTCYINSCLQQLFMCKPFREAVMATPLKESQRTSILHRRDEELVGMDLLMTTRASAASASPSEVSRRIKIVSFNPQTKKHKFKFVMGSNESSAEVNFRSSMKNIRLRLAPTEGDEPANPSQEAATRVVEELQRSFVYMAHSKKRFFDPLHLVEACKTLDLSFTVFQQNDASEFYDKLLDRIEMCTKGKTPENIWTNLFEKNVFGGKTLYQKIPLECERFAGNKDDCGHWQGTRTEAFYKIELQISSHDNINDSLAEFFKTELMDGDNKIRCEVCSEAKTTNRRACLGALPNTMVLHLKRFDMDYSTLETVKLNNKMAFPDRINMLQYTREGVDMREGATAGGDGTGSKEEIQYARDDENLENSPPNPADYDYELQGVLIHAGKAGSGHYYSYARDPDNKERWYRLDDEDVSSFDFSTESVAYNCFGGTTVRENGVEEHRIANALMLFYSKIKVGAKEAESATGEKAAKEESIGLEVAEPAAAGPRMITGSEAFYHEVQESNKEHTLMRYMLDPDLHAFVRNSIIHQPSSTVTEDLNNLKMEPSRPPPVLTSSSKVQFGIRFFLSVVLHCREKSEKAWIVCLGNALVANPQSALWFIQHLTSPTSSPNWLSEYIDTCHEPRAKNAFIQLIVAAVVALSPADPDCLLPYIHPVASPIPTAPPASPTSSAGALAAFIVVIQERIFAIPGSFSRSGGADELFVLIRELASTSACVRRALLELQTISVLSYFLFLGFDAAKNFPLPLQSSILVRFSEPPTSTSRNKPRGYDFDSLISSVLEAIGAILQVPQMRKAPLLVERLVPKSDWGTEELTPEARHAYTVIFKMYAHGEIMGEKEFAAYFSKTMRKDVNPSHCRLYYDRYASSSAKGNSWLYLSGFLSYQADRISLFGDKQAWADLYVHGFRNDLKSNILGEDNSLHSDDAANTAVLPPIPDSCIKCLQCAEMYRNALSYHRQTITKGILQKICSNNAELSTLLISQVDSPSLFLVSSKKLTTISFLFLPSHTSPPN